MVRGSSTNRSVPVLSRAFAVLAVLALLVPASAPAAPDEKEKKGKKPALELRASPRFAFSPASILFTAELKGGDDVEELYCPEVEWEWGDGGKSVNESDCDPWTDATKIQRRFTANHTFQFAGAYRVKVTLRRSGKNIMTQSYSLTIRPGLGDASPDPGM
jgi:plastocyanin